MVVTEIKETRSRQTLVKTQRDKDEQVLSTIWIDKTLVRMLTTAYIGQEKKIVARRKP